MDVKHILTSPCRKKDSEDDDDDNKLVIMNKKMHRINNDNMDIINIIKIDRIE